MRKTSAILPHLRCPFPGTGPLSVPSVPSGVPHDKLGGASPRRLRVHRFRAIQTENCWAIGFIWQQKPSLHYSTPLVAQTGFPSSTLYAILLRSDPSSPVRSSTAWACPMRDELSLSTHSDPRHSLAVNRLLPGCPPICGQSPRAYRAVLLFEISDGLHLPLFLVFLRLKKTFHVSQIPKDRRLNPINQRRTTRNPMLLYL